MGPTFKKKIIAKTLQPKLTLIILLRPEFGNEGPRECYGIHKNGEKETFSSFTKSCEPFPDVDNHVETEIISLFFFAFVLFENSVSYRNGMNYRNGIAHEERTRKSQ